MYGNWMNIYVLEDLYGIKAALNGSKDPKDPEYIECITELLFDPDDLGHSCYMLLDLDTTEDEGEKQWLEERNMTAPHSTYWYHHNRIRALEFIKANIPDNPDRVLVNISY